MTEFAWNLILLLWNQNFFRQFQHYHNYPQLPKTGFSESALCSNNNYVIPFTYRHNWKILVCHCFRKAEFLTLPSKCGDWKTKRKEFVSKTLSIISRNPYAMHTSRHVDFTFLRMRSLYFIKITQNILQNSPYLDHFRQPQAIFWDIILARFARRTVRLRVLSLERQIVRHFGMSLKHGRRLDQYHSYFWLVRYSRQFFRQHMITFRAKQCDSRVKN